MEVLSNRSRKALSVSALLSGAFLAGCGSAEGSDTGETGTEPPSFDPLSSVPTTMEERREASHESING